MKLYVDELPKSCFDCPCAIESRRQQFRDKERMRYSYMEDCMHCIPLDKWIVKRPKNCPLQSLAEHDKQIRKEVVQEVKERAELFGVSRVGIIFQEYRINAGVLDQIEKGETNER